MNAYLALSSSLLHPLVNLYMNSAHLLMLMIFVVAIMTVTSPTIFSIKWLLLIHETTFDKYIFIL